ncbi:head maturation protease, ClpP-related [Lysinibacillus sp. fkY74-1]
MKQIQIKGAIISNDQKEIYDWYDMESTSPYDVTQHLTGEDVEVLINSGGGSVFAGSEIYTALKAYTGKVTVKIMSLAGSSASIIAMGGDVIEISPTAQIMIHNVSMQSGGDHHDMNQAAEILKSATEGLANAYVLKTGIAKDEILAMMDKETWLNADKAVELGFADKVMFTENKQESQPFNPLALVASFNNESILPQQAINKFMEMKNEKKEQEQFDQKRAQHTAQLNLLKLKEIK